MNFTGSPKLNNQITNDEFSYSEGIDYDPYFYEGDIENLRKPWIQEPHFIPTTVIYGCAFLLGIVGNSLVIFAVASERKSRSVTSSLMVSLASADLIFLIVCVPYTTCQYVIHNWNVGEALCKISGFVEMLSAVASILNLSAVSIERFFVIVMPMKSRQLCTAGNTKKIIFCVWVLSIVFSSPTFFVMETNGYTYHNNETTVVIQMCADEGVADDQRLAFALYRAMIMFALPTVIMVLCYTAVIYVLWVSSKELLRLTEFSRPGKMAADKSSRASKRLLPHHPREHSVEVLRARKQVIKMLLAVISVFLLCWGPSLIIQVLLRLNLRIFHNHTAFAIKIALGCLPFIQSCLNPIIYGFMSKNFRKSMKSACSRSFNFCPYSQFMRNRRAIIRDYEMDYKDSNATAQTKLSLPEPESAF
ncbi:hypothetical protein ScPMuIL_005589 [Solemya velum]